MTGALAKMWRRIFVAVGLSSVLGAHFFIVGVSSLILPHSTTQLSLAPVTRLSRFEPGHVSKRRWMMCSPEKAVASYGSPVKDPHLVPKDDTFHPVGSLRELIVAPVPPADCKRFDGIGKKTGGVWRSRVMGLLPSTHADMMRIFDQALSSKSTVVALIPTMEKVLRKRVIQWEQCAASRQEVKLFEDIEEFTLETIARAILRDYATDAIISDILRIAPVQFTGALSIPRRFPWPLNRLPLFSFGQSMKARQEFVGIMRVVLDERKTEVESTTASGGSFKSRRNAGVLGAFVDTQAKQRDAGGPGEGEVEIGDDYIISSVFGMFLAGWKTTSSTISRMVQLLGSVEGKEISEQLIEELSKEVPESDQEALEQTSTARSSSGILSRLLVMEATFLEAIRVKKETSYNGFQIHAGETIQWNTSHGWRSESLYPDPARFCPFRFLERNSEGDYTLSRGKNAKQPLPRPFGFGLRQCRGRELAKMEAFLFLRALLTNFDFKLVEGQSFKGTIPGNEPQDHVRVVLSSKP